MSDFKYEGYVFPNGNIALCDVKTGQQIPELQGSPLSLFFEFAKLKGYDPTQIVMNDSSGKWIAEKTDEGRYWPKKLER